MKIELNATKTRQGWEVTAWKGEEYAGREVFIFYTKREAISKAREAVSNFGGLGLYRS